MWDDATMKLAHELHGAAPMSGKGGHRSRVKRKVVDITPILLEEIRDGVRGLSVRMDGLSERMDGRMDHLDRELVTLRQDVHQEIGKLRSVMDRRFNLLERRVGALEAEVFPTRQ